jgi:hypothetical protein
MVSIMDYGKLFAEPKWMRQLSRAEEIFAEPKALRQINRIVENMEKMTQLSPALQRSIDSANRLSEVWQHQQEIADIAYGKQIRDNLAAWQRTFDMSGVASSLNQVSSVINGFNHSVTAALVSAAQVARTIGEQIDWGAVRSSVSVFADMVEQSQVGLAKAIKPALTGFLAWQHENEAALQGIGRVAVMMNENLTASMSGIAKAVSMIDSDVFRSINQIDWANLRFDTLNNSVIYGDEVFSLDELNEDIADIEAVGSTEAEKQTVKDKLDGIAKKFWLIIAIFQLLCFVPDAAEKLEWFKDNIPKLIDKLFVDDAVNTDATAADVYVYVIKERAALREEPKSKSKKVFQLLYDSQLLVVSTVPRWIEVEYNTDSGETIRGWISKISVEYEDTSVEQEILAGKED